jgi:ubiquinone/menaquinone biosynthesis C-methylase UbiE
MHLDIVMSMLAVNYFKALSDETRLRLVHIIMHYELNVNEIVAIMGMGQSRISRHLKILVDSGLLKSRRDGLWTFYSGVTSGDGYRFLESIKYLFVSESLYYDDLKEATRLWKRRSEETARFFDAIAEDWGKLKREIIGDATFNDRILAAAPDSGTFLDLGCGTGDLLALLHDKASSVIGVDKSPKMLEEARRRFEGNGDNIHLRLGQMEHLPLREGEVDFAVINMVLHHLPEPQKAIQEAYRVLKNGSTFMIVDLLNHNQEIMRERYGDHWLGFTIDDIKGWLKDSGFIFGKSEFFDLKKNLKGFIITSVRR